MTAQKNARDKKAILLVDDDKFLLDMYAMKFAQAGLDAHGELSAADALQTLREGLNPDAILFDLIMPEGDGFSFLADLQKEQLGKRAFKIALTNEMSEEEKQRVMHLGADDFLIKATMIPSEVVEHVIALMDKKRA